MQVSRKTDKGEICREESSFHGVGSMWEQKY